MTQHDEPEQDEAEQDRSTDERPMPGDGTYPATAGAKDEDRPMPGDGTSGHDAPPAEDDPSSADDADRDEATSDDETPSGPDAEPVYNDRDKLDFDPDDGLYTGTAVTGDTAIPGEHERVDDVPTEEDGDSGPDNDPDSADSDSDD